MAGSGKDRDQRLPAPEVVISNPDGSSQPPIDSTRRQTGVAMRLALLLAAAALFAFGVMVGRTTVNVQSGAASRGQAPPATTGSTVPESTDPGAEPSTSPGPTEPSTSPGPTEQAGTESADLGQAGGEANTVPLGLTEIGRECGRPVYLAQVGYVAPLAEPVDMTILAGDPPRPVNLKTGEVGPRLLDLDDGLFTSGFFSDARGTVVVLRSCADVMQATVVRVTGGEATTITVPEGWRTIGGLADVDGEIWLEILPIERGGENRLLATDGSGDTAPLPVIPHGLSDSGATSPDGRRTATVALNTDDTPGYHIEVTDLSTGEAATVPGIRLGAAHPKLTFSPDSRWLVVTVATLVGDRILLYGPDDLTGPYSLPGTVQHPDPAALTIYPTG